MSNSDKTTPIDILNTFLTQFRCIKKGESHTHTRMRGGKWNIPDNKLDEFYTLYNDVLNMLNNTNLSQYETENIERFLSFTERPNSLSPVKIDLDFRYIDYNPTRRYTMEMLQDFGNRLITIMKPWYLISDEESYCFITEKPSPSIDVKKNIDKSVIDTINEEELTYLNTPNTFDLDSNDKSTNKTLKVIKDGVHIMFPYLIIPNEMQLHFREEMLKICGDIFSEMKLMTSDGKPQLMSDVIDISVIDRNNWMLFGSRKLNCSSYQLKKVIEINPDNGQNVFTEIDISDYNQEQLIRLLSMRSEYVNKMVVGGEEPEKRIPGQIRMEKQAELDSNIKQYKITAGKSFAPKGREKNCKPKKLKEDELKIAKMLIDALSIERANNYKQWIEVGWACHNIDERLLIDWINFSKKSSQYTNEAESECIKMWDEMHDEGLGIGSLRYWVKEDNVSKYHEILKEESRSAIMESIEKTINTGEVKLDNALREMKIQPYDVAKVLHAMCRHEYICVSERPGKYGLYYHFANHRWEASLGSILLRSIISDVIPKTYQNIIAEIVSKAKDGNDECKDVLDEWISSLGLFKAQMQTIRSTNFKNNVMQEAIELFYDKESKAKNKFLSKLDDKNCTHLLGFDNGVYDLNKNEFRPGRPEDCISMSTNICYQAYDDWEDDDIRDVLNFVTQVLPDEDERDYVLTLLSSFLYGNNRNERFHIWTGSGGNGKSKLIELYQAAIGDYGCNLPISLLTSKRKESGQASPEMAKLKGRRFAVLQEPDVQSRINVGLMKEMTGGDLISARALYQEPIEFKPQIKMILTCNHLPELPFDDEATWRRVRSVEFKSSFVDPENVDPNNKYSHPKDEELSEKFEGWAEPFMWILLQYYDRWRKHGLKEPASVIAFTKQYQAQNDQFKDFFEECIIKDPVAVEPLTMNKVWQKYTEWHSINETSQKKSKKDLKKYLEKRLEQHHLAGEQKEEGWIGYSLKQNLVDDNSIEESWISDIDQTY